MRVTGRGIFTAAAFALLLYSGAHAVAAAYGHHAPAAHAAAVVHAPHRAHAAPATRATGGALVAGKHKHHLRLYAVRRILHPRRLVRRPWWLRRTSRRRGFRFHPLWWLGF